MPRVLENETTACQTFARAACMIRRKSAHKQSYDCRRRLQHRDCTPAGPSTSKLYRKPFAECLCQVSGLGWKRGAFRPAKHTGLRTGSALSLASVGIGGRCRGTISGKNQDDLPGLCIPKLFSRLTLNSFRVGLQGFVNLGEGLVFLLEAINFGLELAILVALLFVHHGSVGAEYHVEGQEGGQQRNRRSGQLAPVAQNAGGPCLRTVSFASERAPNSLHSLDNVSERAQASFFPQPSPWNPQLFD